MRDDQLAQREYVSDGLNGVVTVGVSTHSLDAHAEAVLLAIRDEIARQKLDDVEIKIAGCAGFFSQDVLVKIAKPDKPPVLYGRVTPETAPELIAQHLKEGVPVAERALCQIPSTGRRIRGIPTIDDVNFFFHQHLITSWRCGHIDPERIEDYFRTGGYLTLSRVMDLPSRDVMAMIREARVYDRGGAGYDVTDEWAEVAAASTDKFIVCNALEVEPASVKDRRLIESDPHAVLEGMLIAAYALGARIGYLVLNPAYTLARKRIDAAVAQARRHRRLGRGIRGRAFDFDIIVLEGPPNYATGEETALVSFLNGKAGPRLVPPPVTQSGFSGQPTIVANAETFAHLPMLPFDPDQERPWSTRLYTLEGTVNTGVVEVEDDTTLRTLICTIGGTPESEIKGAVIGGHAGGILPVEELDTPLTAETLGRLGVRPGTGLVTALNASTDMLEWLRAHLRFAARESCGLCTPCREGLEQSRRIMERLCDGDGRAEDLALLDQLVIYVKTSSLCGYGHTVPAGITTALRYFGNDIRAGIETRR